MAANLTLVSSNPALSGVPNILARDGNFYPLVPIDAGVQLTVPPAVYGDDLVTLGFSFPATA